MLITVFTPLYNRKDLVVRLYQSLCRQTCYDFEWLVVDDGSKDHPEELFNDLCQRDYAFHITFLQQENGGKHRAINQGLKYAKGEFFLICDSDDYLSDDAIEKVESFIQTSARDLSNQEAKLMGVSGLRITPEGKYLLWKREENGNLSMYGEKPDFTPYIDCTMADTPLFGLYGDKAEVFKTEILKQYPFPEFEDENFMTEMVVWNRLSADGWKLRFFNEPIMICEYRDDGLTEQGSDYFIQNPKGYGLYLREDIYNKSIQLQSFKMYYNHEITRISEQEIAENLGIENCNEIKQEIMKEYQARLDEINIMLESAGVLKNIQRQIEDNQGNETVLNQMNMIKEQVRMLLNAKIQNKDEIDFVMTGESTIVAENLLAAKNQAEQRIAELRRRI